MCSHSFTREDLYDLAWSEPMIKLGARFGISGNGLKKACKRANIPVPPQGYGNKLHAGHKVMKAPLPPASAKTLAKVTIDPPAQRPAPPPPPPIPPSVQEKIEAERQSGKPVIVPWVQDSAGNNGRRVMMDGPVTCTRPSTRRTSTSGGCVS
jgi:hypothetical protein